MKTEAVLATVFCQVICAVGSDITFNFTKQPGIYHVFFGQLVESSFILRIFLLKALLLGLVGGVGGFVIGTVLAVTLGPRLAGVPVLPMPILALWALVISVGITLLASFFPARRAARLDPVATFQEI